MNSLTQLTPIYPIAAQFVERGGWQVPEVFSTAERETAVLHHRVGLIDCSGNGKISVQGHAADSIVSASHLSIGQGMETDFGQVYRLRHNLFYLSTPPGDEAAMIQRLETAVQQSGEFVTVTDITHGRSEFCLVGPKSAELLSRLCGLDFHPTRFPNLTARQSSVAKTTQLIIRRDVGNLPAYSLIGARSFGMYLWQTILKAGRDLGVEPVGWAAFENALPSMAGLKNNAR